MLQSSVVGNRFKAVLEKSFGEKCCREVLEKSEKCWKRSVGEKCCREAL